MALDNGNAATFTPEGVPSVSGLDQDATTPSTGGGTALPQQNSPLNAQMAGAQTDAIESSAGKPGDWARGILSGALKTMGNTADLMAGFGSEGEVKKGGSGVFEGIGAGARQAQATAAQREQLKMQKSELQIEQMKANLYKVRQSQLIADHDLAQVQDRAAKNVAFMKDQDAEQTGDAIPEEQLTSAVKDKFAKDNHLDPHDVQWEMVDATEGSNGQIQHLWAPFRLDKVTVTQDMADTLAKYGAADATGLKVGQTLSGLDAKKINTAYQQAQHTELVADQISAYQNSANLSKQQLADAQEAAADRDNMKKAQTIFGGGQYHVGNSDPLSMLDSWEKLKDAAGNGDAKASFALPYITQLMGGMGKIAELQEQYAKQIDEDRSKLAIGALTHNESIAVLNADQKNMTTSQNRLAKLQAAQAAAQKNPQSLTAAALQELGVKSAADFPGAIQQAQGDLKTAQDQYNQDRDAINKKPNQPNPNKPNTPPPPKKGDTNTHAGATYKFNGTVWVKQ